MDAPELTALQQEQLRGYAAAVRASPHNLLSRRGLEELESRHIRESLLLAAGLPAGPRQLLDLGTGGGLPGMVVAIARPDLQVTLLDATEKKIVFLGELAHSLGVEVQTLHGRAEDLALQHGGAYDVVLARAVAPLARLVPWAAPFLGPGGVLLAIKGERWPQELSAARRAIDSAGLVVLSTPPTDRQETDRFSGPRVVSIGRPAR